MSGLVKHDDSDTAQRSSYVHALIKYAARQVSSILTSLDAFTRDFFYFGAITQLQLYCKQKEKKEREKNQVTSTKTV